MLECETIKQPDGQQYGGAVRHSPDLKTELINATSQQAHLDATLNRSKRQGSSEIRMLAGNVLYIPIAGEVD
jgi:hypothetical protein